MSSMSSADGGGRLPAEHSLIAFQVGKNNVVVALTASSVQIV